MTGLSALVGRPLRVLRSSPLFSLATLLTLAVGIGANTAIFSVVYGVLLEPLPFEEPDRLVGVWHRAPGMKIDRLDQGPAFHMTYRDENRVFEHIGMWNRGSASVTGIGEPERIRLVRVTEGVLRALRVTPTLGRLFTREDDLPGAPKRAILTDAYFQRRFAGDRHVVGRRLVVDGQPCEVAGVLPAETSIFGSDIALFLPMQVDPAQLYIGNFSYSGLARLKPGVTIERANADIARMIPIVVDRFPMPPGFTRDMLKEIRLGPNVHALATDVIGDVGPVLWLLLGAVGLVLLIACANAANLFLLRTEGRQQELAVRAALGASWGRLAGSLAAESITLALVGGAIGTGLAWAGLRLLRRLAPSGLPRLEEIGIGPEVLLFTIGVAVAAGLLFGLVAVARYARPGLAALKDGGRSTSEGRQRHRTRSGLVVAEIALAVVLLVGASLMIRTFQRLHQVDPGFVDAASVLTMRISIPETIAAKGEPATRLHEQVVRGIEQVPGVTSVGLSSSITMEGNNSHDPVFVEDAPVPEGQIPVLRRHKWISPGYFETMGHRLLAGRGPSWADLYSGTPVAVVSDSLAREYWKTPEAAIGRRVRETPKSPWREVIGVVGDARDDGVDRPAPKVVYWPFRMRQFWGEADFSQRNMAYAIRATRLGSPGLLRDLQKAVWSVNPDLPLANVRTLDQIVADSMARTSFALVMLGIAASVALLLGVVGIYGVIAYITVQRTREIGIRMALGAEPADVARLFVRYGLALVSAGLTIGLMAAAALSRLMASLLHGVSATDPVSFAAAALGLGVIALTAGCLPAMRAARMQPVTALRTDAR